MKVIIIIAIISVLSGCANNKQNKTKNINKHKGHSHKYHLTNDKYPEKSHVPDLSKIKDAVPKAEPKSRYGNPKSYMVNNQRYNVLETSKGYKEKGLASWYGVKFQGFRTSSGEPYNMYAMTAAHKTLPLPSYVKVTNLENNRSVVVKVIDRGPFISGRVIDLSYAAANKLDILKKGTGKVLVETIKIKQIKSAPLLDKNYGSNHSHYVQLGAFKDKINAANFIHQIRNDSNLSLNEYKISIHEDSSLYKVQLGPIHSNKLDYVKENIKKLSNLNIEPHSVIR